MDHCLRKYQDIPGLSGYRNGTWKFKSSVIAPVKVNVAFVYARDGHEATITGTVLSEKVDGVEHARSYCTLAEGVVRWLHTPVISTWFRTLEYRDGPGVNELRLANEFFQVGQDSRMVDQVVEDRIKSW